MNFNKHLRLKDKHAFLSASKYHWINYSEEKLQLAFNTAQAAARGTALHNLAAELIELNVKLPKTEETLNMYVNDAIGFKLKPEVALYYSDNCFGTADGIGFLNNKLRIHDLKTGRIPASFTQLEIYAAMFCLEYRHDPFKIEIELRVYQNNEVQTHIPLPESIRMIMDKIILYDKHIDKMREGELL